MSINGNETRRQSELRYMKACYDLIADIQEPSKKIRELQIILEYKLIKNDPEDMTLKEVANIYQKVRYVQGIENLKIKVLQ